jgi:site-specific recombinase XerD
MQGIHAPKQNPRVDRLVDGYMASLKAEGLSAASVAARCSEAATFRNWSAERHTADISVECLDQYIAWRTKGFRRASIATVVKNLRGFMRYLHATHVVDRDFSEAVTRPRLYRDSHIPSALPAAAIDTVLSSTHHDRSTVGRRDYAILMLLAAYGLRAGEITRLTLDDINWETMRLRVQHAKTGMHNELPLSVPVAKAIVVYLKSARPPTASRLLFLRARAPRHEGISARACGTVVRRRLSRAGVQWSGRRGSHAFRHARATTLLRSGVQLKIISDILGHQSPRTTQIYAKLAIGDLRRVCLNVPMEAM